MSRTISDLGSLLALPAGAVVRSAAGTIACRDLDGRGGVFGSTLAFEWSKLALPVQVLWEGNS